MGADPAVGDHSNRYSIAAQLSVDEEYIFTLPEGMEILVKLTVWILLLVIL